MPSSRGTPFFPVKSPERFLLQDVQMRWNSIYVMLERLLEQRKAINLCSTAESTVSIVEWELAGRDVKILKPFYAATLEICSD